MTFIKTVAAIALGILIALSIAVAVYVEYRHHESWTAYQAQIKKGGDKMRAEAKEAQSFYTNCVAARTYTERGEYREVSDAEIHECWELMTAGVSRNLACYKHVHPESPDPASDSVKAVPPTVGLPVGAMNDGDVPTLYPTVMSKRGYEACMAQFRR